MARLSAAGRGVVDRLQAARGPLRLTVDGQPVELDVVAALSIVARSRGLLGRRSVPHALLLHPCSSVHSIGMMVALEVAYLDRDLEVLDVAHLPPWRVQLPRRRAVAVLEAAPGALSASGVVPGARLGVVP